MASADDDSHRWPGDELGLPASGPGSLAPWGRRVLAVFIDWGIASLISVTWFAYDVWATLGIFVLLHVALTGLLGVTIGKRLVRIQVVRGHSAPGPHRALLRTALMLLVVPVLVISADGRGAHDRIAGTVQLRM
ncbi:RDD family protein [Nesterenkonia sp.]|uniref:RDD family protein n=1 Tax=Nesterenkonia sp. TaxID=704201 RepID=UPI002607913B|nr:RDD family protein [Nesterenkonia sp.]